MMFFQVNMKPTAFSFIEYENLNKISACVALEMHCVVRKQVLFLLAVSSPRK